MKKIFIFCFLSLLCFLCFAQDDRLCHSEQSTMVCIFDTKHEYKKVTLYQKGEIIGEWLYLIQNGVDFDISIDKKRVNFVFFSPPLISGFSIEASTKAYVSEYFKEFRVESLNGDVFDKVILQAKINQFDGAKPTLKLMELPLSLYSSNKEVKITAKKAKLRYSKEQGAKAKPYVLKGDIVRLLSYENGQFFVSYKGEKKIFFGWIYISDIL